MNASSGQTPGAVPDTAGNAATPVRDAPFPKPVVKEGVENVAGVPSSISVKEGHDMLQKLKNKFYLHRQQTKATIQNVIATLATEDVVSGEELKVLEDATSVILSKRSTRRCLYLPKVKRILCLNGNILAMSAQSNAVHDLFMIVICGEFNSGKSSVVNVLLRDCGHIAMSVGSLPTTNAITVIRYTVK